MELGLTETQEMLRKSARDFLEKECPKSLIRKLEKDDLGFSRELYAAMADLGWLGLHLPPEYGGSGGTTTDLAILYEEIGRNVVPGPHFVSSVLCADIILTAGSEAQKRALLPDIAQGMAIVTLALYEDEGGYEPSAIQLSAKRQGDGYVLDGTKLFVPFARGASHLLCVARTAQQIPTRRDGISLFLVPTTTPGVKATALDTLDVDRQYEVAFSGVAVSGEGLVGKAGQGWEVLQGCRERANVIQCAEMVGGAQKALEMAVDYSKQRVQFGRPIGSFQAIQHKAAGMLSDTDGARFLTYEAVAKLDAGQQDAVEVAMAKAFVAGAFRRVTKEAHQIIAGAAFLVEHDLHFYYRRAKAMEMFLGDTDFHVEQVAQRLFDAPTAS
ncbi:MAG: acyl-CoA/acyl-ACP dehydrogenase [Chloroflexi bacterium]|nr:acyl-CoA/acyl-ACP dehydrogenase [Chloroflexota bacterium]